MRKVYLIFIGLFLCTNVFGATGRSANTITRTETKNTIVRQTTNRSKSNVINRSTDSRKTASAQKNTSGRSAVKTVSARSAPQKITKARIATSQKRFSRAATTTQNVTTRTFSADYETCRDAYFTCMDQFCAGKDETYRRCICSAKIQEIKQQQSLLSQTATSLQDFYDYNIDAIPKTAEEIMAMQNATEGEQSIKQDKSNSALTLNSIKDVLYNVKQNVLDSEDKSNVIGNVQTIWETTDLIHGADIIELSGEQLYNAVHSQCSSLIKSQCASTSDLKMVISAYGMYIENDCAVLESAVHSKVVDANADIRATRHKMQDTRLENYNAHNSLSLNDCVKQVRADITKESAAACGADYIHCLDITGLYLNKTTGEPIYSPQFYELENQLSLSGDILKNAQNASLVKILNGKRVLAETTLDSCRDVADDVWTEFLRQAIVEIYQNQSARIKQVKDKCLNVVNQCYASKHKDLTEYAGDVADNMTPYSFEAAEQMCQKELNTCANLYGGGPEGMSLLISTMSKVTELNIAQECPALLENYLEQICAVSANDSIHSYPYGCRMYAPGEAQYATMAKCNSNLNNPYDGFEYSAATAVTKRGTYSNCPGKTDDSIKNYTKCNPNYFLAKYVADNENGGCPDVNATNITNALPTTGTKIKICCPCVQGYMCPGAEAQPINMTNDNRIYEHECGTTYIGSLYQSLVRYAIQNCARATTKDNEEKWGLPEYLSNDVQSAMDTVRQALIKELSTDCERYNGIWVEIPWQDDNRDNLHDVTGDEFLRVFYTATNANKLWGYCKPK